MYSSFTLGSKVLFDLLKLHPKLRVQIDVNNPKSFFSGVNYFNGLEWQV